MVVLNIPNTLTIARIIIIPIVITLIIYKRYDYALYLFIIAALTDVLDGLFARMRNQRTTLGTFLDPIADKFLLVSSFIVFSIYGWIPKWVTITVISRDIIIVTGWLILFFTSGASRVEPSILGKTTVWLQSLLIVYVLFSINIATLPDVPPFFHALTAGATILSGIHYLIRGLKTGHAV
jgi:cardiolipin synthase (CMP-forming)